MLVSPYRIRYLLNNYGANIIIIYKLNDKIYIFLRGDIQKFTKIQIKV